VGRRILAGFGTLFVIIFFGAAPFAAAAGRTIEVNGRGEAKAKPDTMLLSFVVEAKGDSADESTTALTERAKALGAASIPNALPRLTPREVSYTAEVSVTYQIE